MSPFHHYFSLPRFFFSSSTFLPTRFFHLRVTSFRLHQTPSRLLLWSIHTLTIRNHTSYTNLATNDEKSHSMFSFLKSGGFGHNVISPMNNLCHGLDDIREKLYGLSEVSCLAYSRTSLSAHMLQSVATTSDYIDHACQTSLSSYHSSFADEFRQADERFAEVGAAASVNYRKLLTTVDYCHITNQPRILFLQFRAFSPVFGNIH